MMQLENLMTRLDETMQEFSQDDIQDVLSMVPWARESVHSYLTSHGRELEKDVRARIEEMLNSAL